MWQKVSSPNSSRCALPTPQLWQEWEVTTAKLRASYRQPAQAASTFPLLLLILLIPGYGTPNAGRGEQHSEPPPYSEVLDSRALMIFAICHTSEVRQVRKGQMEGAPLQDRPHLPDLFAFLGECG